MNHIETGIEEAHSGLNDRYTKSEISNQLSGLSTDIASARAAAENA